MAQHQTHCTTSHQTHCTTYMYVCAGIQRRDSGLILNIFRDPQFSPFHNSLDGEMKCLQSCVLGTKKRQAEVIPVDEEEKLWSTAGLGDFNPQQLLHTVVYYCGLFFLH